MHALLTETACHDVHRRLPALPLALLAAAALFFAPNGAQAQVAVDAQASAGVAVQTPGVVVQYAPVQPPAAQAMVVAPAPAAAVVVEPAPPRHRIGIDAAVVVPVGDYAHVADLGAGALFRYEIDVIPALSITSRIGYIHHVGELDSGLIPIMAGAKYRFMPDGATPYLHGELGLTIIWASVNTGFGSASDTDTQLGLALGGGYDFGGVDLGAALYLPDADDAVGFLFTLGVDLARF